MIQSSSNSDKIYKPMPRVIGLAGISKSGKDTFCQSLFKLRPGGIRISIGDIIRKDCSKLIKNYLDIDVNKCSSIEKEIIRPILIGYGISQRVRTKGAYFRDILDEQIAVWSSQQSFVPDVNYFVVTDIRFAEYEYDEPEWVKANKGILAHISRYDPVTYHFTEPTIDSEKRNDPLLRDKADYLVEWPTENTEANFDQHVNRFLKFLDSIQNKTS